MSLASSRVTSKASGTSVGGRLVPEYCLAAERNVHVGGCPAWDPGCSKRKVMVPLSGGMDMKSPWSSVSGSSQLHSSFSMCSSESNSGLFADIP
jgi:hypothetical protein